jgi:hypothetical protein
MYLYIAYWTMNPNRASNVLQKVQTGSGGPQPAIQSVPAFLHGGKVEHNLRLAPKLRKV